MLKQGQWNVKNIQGFFGSSAMVAGGQRHSSTTRQDDCEARGTATQARIGGTTMQQRYGDTGTPRHGRRRRCCDGTTMRRHVGGMRTMGRRRRHTGAAPWHGKAASGAWGQRRRHTDIGAASGAWGRRRRHTGVAAGHGEAVRAGGRPVGGVAATLGGRVGGSRGRDGWLGFDEVQ